MPEIPENYFGEDLPKEEDAKELTLGYIESMIKFYCKGHDGIEPSAVIYLVHKAEVEELKAG